MKFFLKNCEFKIGATHIDHIPSSHYPEVAFAGRSNVGKSSLLNALTNNSNLARVSKNPGCTRQINFFLLDEKIMMVDLPGYGFARVSKKEIKGWDRLIKDYLLGRPNLKRVSLLIDSRRGVMKNDEEIMTLLDEYAVSYQIVFTKTDQEKYEVLEKLRASIAEFCKKHIALHSEPLFTSAHKSDGLHDVQKAIVQFK